jgi:hypothetical protein
MRISKSKFVAGIQCLKRLYWQVHEPELAAELDDSSEAVEQGHQVGLLAHQRFRAEWQVSSSGGLEQAIRATRELSQTAKSTPRSSTGECSCRWTYCSAGGTTDGVWWRSNRPLTLRNATCPMSNHSCPIRRPVNPSWERARSLQKFSAIHILLLSVEVWIAR